MSDLISRKALLEEIKENQWGWFSREMMILMLENQPSVTDTNVGCKWIPCSERLPDIDMSSPNAKDYLVYYEHGYYDVASYSNINRFWHEYTTEPYWNCEQYCKVIAWMPLPPAFKGE